MKLHVSKGPYIGSLNGDLGVVGTWLELTRPSKEDGFLITLRTFGRTL
jgi:hypothetical protein